MLAIMRVDGARNQDLHRTRCITIEPIHQNRVHRQAFINHVRLAYRGIDIDLGAPLGGCIVGRTALLFRRLTSRNKVARRPVGRLAHRRLRLTVQMRIRIRTRCRLCVARVRINKVRCKSSVIRQFPLPGGQLLRLFLFRRKLWLRIDSLLLARLARCARCALPSRARRPRQLPAAQVCRLPTVRHLSDGACAAAACASF